MMIRLATYTDDIERFVELGKLDHARCQYRDIPYDEGSVLRMLVSMIDEQLLLIAEDEGKVAGAIGAQKVSLPFNDQYFVGVMRFWWVDLPYQKTRLSMGLLDALEKSAADANCRGSLLYSTDIAREKALVRMFSKRGYLLIERAFLKMF